MQSHRNRARWRVRHSRLDPRFHGRGIPHSGPAFGSCIEATKHLSAARAIIAIDQAGAYVLAYDAARKSIGGPDPRIRTTRLNTVRNQGVTFSGDPPETPHPPQSVSGGWRNWKLIGCLQLHECAEGDGSDPVVDARSDSSGVDDEPGGKRSAEPIPKSNQRSSIIRGCVL